MDGPRRWRMTMVGLGAGAVLLGAAACGQAAKSSPQATGSGGGAASGGAGGTANGSAGGGATGGAGGGTGGTAMPGMSMPPGATASGGSPAVAADQVAIKGFAFAPGSVRVKVGTTVTWTNDDEEAHTVTSSDGKGPLHSPAMQPGATYQIRFDKPGTYPYLCTIHPFMRGSVVVTP